MTTRPATRRLLVRAAPPVGLGALALAAKYYVGMAGWTVAVSALAGAFISVLPALLPQESEHRRDVWRDWLRHRERMARLRITAAEVRSGSARLRTDHREPSDCLRELPEGLARHRIPARFCGVYTGKGPPGHTRHVEQGKQGKNSPEG
ncbi:hypothetical protein [Streptomyces sp. NPDC051636]|uniref:hypothetical protein n=1 Tax=Streptomyces sp. NPDC051636 TaxID=3365663 RepID=UPI00378E8FD5